MPPAGAVEADGGLTPARRGRYSGSSDSAAASSPNTYPQAPAREGPITALETNPAMPAMRSTRTVVLCCAAALLAGCGQTVRPRGFTPLRPMPPGIQGTVGHYADLVGSNAMLVRGYGVVVGLGRNGSAEVPSGLKKYLTQQMLKQDVGSHLAGTEGLRPSRMLEDKDTAVVIVAGWIPPAAPKGTRFDLRVEALPQTQTVSLAGGTLMSTELRLALNTPAGLAGEAKTWAVAQGDLFTNPFVESVEKDNPARLRSASVLHGGVVVKDRPLRLELRRPDYRVAMLMQRRINQRFGAMDKIAAAKGPSMVELRIPPPWRKDYEHFLRLVTHTYVQGGPSEEERHARELTEAVLLPTARCEDISLVWEAMGRQVLPVIQPLYASRHPAAAFYASRAGLRMGDPLAVEPMIHLAEQTNSIYQVPAIREMGRARRFVQCLAALKRLLSSTSDLVRVAAYEALLTHGSATAVRRTAISGQFVLDVVDSQRDYTIYATRSGRPKVVVFGKDLVLRRPVFYCRSDDLVTINANDADDRVMVERKIPRVDRMSKPLSVSPTTREAVRKLGQHEMGRAVYTSPRVEDLVKLLGSMPTQKPDGRIEGLALTYSQVVGVLYDLCRKDHIGAKFVLQRSGPMRKIYMLTPAVGRPDMPEETGP